MSGDAPPEDAVAGVLRGIQLTTAVTLAASGTLKLTPAGRDSGRQAAFGHLVPGFGKKYRDEMWVATAGTELAIGVGLAVQARSARLAAPVVGLGAVAYTFLASRVAPERPCGCMGAESVAPVGDAKSRARLVFLLCVGSALTPIHGHGISPDRKRSATFVASATMAMLSGAVGIALVSPEVDRLRHRFRDRRVERRFKGEAAFTRELQMSRSWKILGRYVDPRGTPTSWQEDGNHYIEFPADESVGRASVAFMSYRTDEDGWRIRGVLASHDTGEVLIKT